MELHNQALKLPFLYHVISGRLLRAKTAPTPQPLTRGSKLDAYRDDLTERWQAHRLSAVRLFAEIQTRGFTGSVKIVCRFLAQLQAAHRTDPRLTVCFETPPGEQAQCDWAEVGRYPQPDDQGLCRMALS